MAETGDTTTPRRALVTGATGFIGGRLATAWLRRGHAVRVLVRRDSRAGELEGAERFTGDLCDPASLAGVEDGIDVVVHCAGMLGKWGTAEDELRAVNVDGPLNLLRRFAGRETRFVHLSAGGVTGPVPTKVVDETYEPRPATPYERTKWQAERRVLALARELGVPATVVRPTFTYGPGDPHKLALFRAVRRGRFAFIGDGESVLHPVYVDDLLAGIDLAVERGRVGETYIVGGEHPVTKNELIFTIADALGAPHPRLRVPRRLAWTLAGLLETAGRVTGREPILTRSRVMMMGDNFGYSIHKARHELGYVPMTGLKRGIRLTVDAYVEQGLL